MTMKKLSLIMLFLMTLACYIKAQVNFVDGFILKSQFDTLKGFINDKNYKKNALFCDFRKTKSDETSRYFPSDIYGYRINNGKFYISKKVNTRGRDTVLFLEYLIDGEMDFYFRQDERNQNHFYVSKDSTQIYELRYSKEMMQIENRTFEKESREFVGVLKFLTQDYPEFAAEIESTVKPRHTNLVRLGEEYHNYVCKERECIIYDKPMPFRFSVEIVGGYSKTTKKIDYYKKIDDSFYGANLYVNNAEFNEKVFIGIGYQVEGRYADLDLDFYGVVLDSNVYRQVKIPLILGYSSNRKGFSPTLSTSVNISLIHKDIETRVSYMPGFKYNFKNIYLRTYAEFEFLSAVMVPLRYFSTNFGFGLGFNL